MLMGIQDLLDSPNPNSPAQSEAYNLFVNNKAEYKRRVKAEARKNTPASWGQHYLFDVMEDDVWRGEMSKPLWS